MKAKTHGKKNEELWDVIKDLVRSTFNNTHDYDKKCKKSNLIQMMIYL